MRPAVASEHDAMQRNIEHLKAELAANAVLASRIFVAACSPKRTCATHSLHTCKAGHTVSAIGRLEGSILRGFSRINFTVLRSRRISLPANTIDANCPGRDGQPRYLVGHLCWPSLLCRLSAILATPSRTLFDIRSPTHLPREKPCRLGTCLAICILFAAADRSLAPMKRHSPT